MYDLSDDYSLYDEMSNEDDLYDLDDEEINKQILMKKKEIQKELE